MAELTKCCEGVANRKVFWDISRRSSIFYFQRVRSLAGYMFVGHKLCPVSLLAVQSTERNIVTVTFPKRVHSKLTNALNT